LWASLRATLPQKSAPACALMRRALAVHNLEIWLPALGPLLPESARHQLTPTPCFRFAKSQDDIAQEFF